MKKLLLMLLTICGTMLSAQNSYHRSPANDLFAKGISIYSKNVLSKNLDEGINYFEQAAAFGNNKAMYYLGKIYSTEKNYLDGDKATYWFNKAQAAGNTNCFMDLAQIYNFGKLGIKQDFAKANYYYTKAANLGNENALKMLGYFYYKGLNGEQDYTKSFTYFSQAAQKGNSTAIYFLGVMYRNGYGIPVDIAKAKNYLTQASSLNEKQAITELKLQEPENPFIPITKPNAIELNNNGSFKRIKHNVNSNSINGRFTGYVIRYDFSGKHILSIQPLEVNFNNINNAITGEWKEGTDKANFNAAFTDTALLFSNTQYNKVDHNTIERGGEIWQFKQAEFNLLQQPDSIYVAGNMQLYSVWRKEPSVPMYIHLARAATNADIVNNKNLILNCNNPFNNNVTINFVIPQTTEVVLKLQTIQGQPIVVKNAGKLIAGTYTYDLPISKTTPAGSYILQLQTATGNETKIIVKQ